MSEFVRCDGGRIKMAGGSVNKYYEAADPMIREGTAGALETYDNFTELRTNPPAELKAAFFPSVGRELQQRVKGAGLYRHFRMDQGPGGNFAAFTTDQVSGTGQPAAEVLKPKSHALLEESIAEAVTSDPELDRAATAVMSAYAAGQLGQTFGLLNQFAVLLGL